MKKRMKLWMARILVMFLVVTQIQPIPVQAMEMGEVPLEEISIQPEATVAPTSQPEEATEEEILPMEEEMIINPIVAPTFAPAVVPTEEPKAESIAEPIQEPERDTDLTFGENLDEGVSSVLSATVAQKPYQNTFYSEIGWYTDEIIEGLVLKLTLADGSTKDCAFGDSVWNENRLSYTTTIKDGTGDGFTERCIEVLGSDGKKLVELPYYVKSIKETDATLTIGESVAYKRGQQVYKITLEPGLYEIAKGNGFSAMLDGEGNYLQCIVGPLYEIKTKDVYYVAVNGTEDSGDKILSIRKPVMDKMTAGTPYVSNYNANGETRWFKFVPEKTGVYNIRLNDSGNVNKEFGVYKTSEGIGHWSQGTWNRFEQEHLVAGNTYYFRLTYSAGYSGTYTMSVEQGKTVTDIKIVRMPYRTELYYGMEKAYFENFYGLKLGVTFEDGSYIEYYSGCKESSDYQLYWEIQKNDGTYPEYQEYLPVGDYKIILGVGASIKKVEVPFSVTMASDIDATLSVNSPLEYTQLPEHNYKNYAKVEISEPGQYSITSHKYLSGEIFDSAFQRMDTLSGFGNLVEFTKAGTYYIRVYTYDCDYKVSLVKTKKISKIEAYLLEGKGTYYGFPNTDVFADAFLKVTFTDGTSCIPKKYSDDWYTYVANQGIYYRGTNNWPQWDQERQCYPAGEYDVRVTSAAGTDYNLPITIKDVNEYNVVLKLGEKLNIKSESANHREYVKVYCPEAGQYSISLGEDNYLNYEFYDSSLKKLFDDWGDYCAFEAKAPGYYYVKLYFGEAGREVTLSMEKLVPLVDITLHEDGDWVEYYGVPTYTICSANKSYTLHLQDGRKITVRADEYRSNELVEKYNIHFELLDKNGEFPEWDENGLYPVGEYQLTVVSTGMNIFDQKKYEVRDKAEITKTLKCGQKLTGLEGNNKYHYVKVIFEEPGLYGFVSDSGNSFFEGFCTQDNVQLYDRSFALNGLQVDVKTPGTYYLLCQSYDEKNFNLSVEKVKRATGLKVLGSRKQVYDGCYHNTLGCLDIRYEMTFADGTKESFLYGDETERKYALSYTVYNKDGMKEVSGDYTYPEGEYLVRVKSMLTELYDFSCEIEFSVVPMDKASAYVLGEEVTIQQGTQFYKLSVPKTGKYGFYITGGSGWFEVFDWKNDTGYILDENDKVTYLELTAGEYQMVVYNQGFGNKLPITFHVSAAQPVEIIKQPVDVSVVKGATAKVSVSAVGEGLKYQWYYTSDGKDTIFYKSSNTTNTYSTTMDASRDGRKVYCVVTDKNGNKATSNTVTLKMKADTAVKITKQPVGVSVSKGATATVSVTATGEGLKYQWYYTSNGSSSYFNKSSNTTNTYSTTMDATRDGRKVYCVVTDKYGNKVTSNTVTLKMKAVAVKITEQPASVTVSKGATATVSVTATGEGLKYQWYYTSNGSATYFNKSGNTTATYSTAMDATRDGRKVYCVVTDKYGNKVTSNTVTLKMNSTTAVTITKQPASVTVSKGATATVSVTAMGEGLKYQWYYTSNGSSSYFNKSSNATATYSTTMDATRDGRKVYCVVTDKYGNKVTSNTVTLKMNSTTAVTITKQPASVTVSKGATAIVSVTATGEGLKYQWYYTSNGSSSYFNKSSNTTNTYSTSMDATRDGRKVYCVVTDKYGNKVTSNTVTLKMNSTTAVTITKQPASVTVAKGATAKVSVQATGEGLKYQWYYTSNGSTNYFNKSSNTTATYSTTMDATKAGRKVYCVVTDKYGNKVTSNTVSLNMSK